LSKKAIEFLIEKGYDPAYGARPLRRAVEKYLEDAIAEEIIKGTITEAVTVNVDYKDGDENLKFRIPKSKSKGSDKAVKSD
jgi:ATP-dependent Clp protease ATP-binding subunit ClpC